MNNTEIQDSWTTLHIINDFGKDMSKYGITCIVLLISLVGANNDSVKCALEINDNVDVIRLESSRFGFTFLNKVYYNILFYKV